MIYQAVLVSGDPGRGYRLRTMVDEIEDVELVEIAESSADVLEILGRRECHVLVVDVDAGPVAALDVVRDVQTRLPYVGMLVLGPTGDGSGLEAAVDAGSRGLLDLGEPFDEVRRRLLSAGDWSVKVRGVPGSSAGVDGVGCHVVGLVGAKGGVGTTALAVHLALGVRATLPRDARVCLVDLDVAKSDVPAYLPVTPRRDIADLAGVGDLVSLQAVQDVVFPHSSGVDVLCSPKDVERSEDVTAALVRGVLLTLRQSYDVVLVDGGASVTDVLVSALEVCDEVLVVSTPDVPSLRGVKRLVDACDRLGVRTAAEMRLVLNRTSSRDELQHKTVARMTTVPLTEASVPAAYRKLEGAANLRDPARLTDKSVLAALGQLTREVLSTWARNPGVLAPATRTRRGRRPALAADSGVLSVEFMTLMPIVLLLIAGCVQGVAYVGANFQAVRAAGAAAHAAARATGDADALATTAARDTASPAFTGRITGVSVSGGGSSVRAVVTVTVPRVVPAPFSGDLVVTADAGAVRER